MKKKIKIKYKTVRSAPRGEIIELYKQGGWWKDSSRERKTVPAIIKNSFCFMIAVANNKKIVGMGRVISDGVSDGYVQDVVVHKDFRGLGIGRVLIKKLTGFCVKKKLSWIGLISEPGKERFYTQLGYRQMHKYTSMLFSKDRQSRRK